MHLGVNLEFARTDGLTLEEAMARAAQAGFEYVEPYVYTPLSLSINSHLAILPFAEARGVRYAVELHNALTTLPDMLQRLLGRFGPESLGVNFDTGNAFLAGNDPVEYLRDVAGRVVHVHVKDIPAWQGHLRGKVTGTRVGVAVGDGEIDLPGVVAVLAQNGYRGVLSVECDTLDQAVRSREYLGRLVGPA